MSLRSLTLSIGVCLLAQEAAAAALTDGFDYPDGIPRWPWNIQNESPRVENEKLVLTSSGWPRDALVTAFDGDEGLLDYRVDVQMNPSESFPYGNVFVRTDGFYRGSDKTSGNAYDVNFARRSSPWSPALRNGPANTIYIARVEDGTYALLERKVGGDLPTGPFDVAVTVRDEWNADAGAVQARIEVEVDGVLALAAVDRAPLSGGGIGFYTIWESRTRFDDFALTTFDDSTVVPLPGAVPLLASGLVALGIVGRWRRSADASTRRAGGTGPDPA